MPLTSSVVAGRGTPSRPERSLLSNTWKWVVWDTCWQSERLCWKGVPRRGEAGFKNPGELLCHVARGFYDDGISFWLSPANHSDSGSFLWCRQCSSKRSHQGGLWEVGGDMASPFPNSSGWWWFVSSVFLSRTSYHKITHASHYVVPGLVGSSSQCVSPDSMPSGYP